MAGRIDEIVTQLMEGGEATAALFRALPPEAWEVPVYTEDAHWRVHEIIAHFITIERSMHHLFRDLLAGGPGTGDDFDLDRYNQSQVAKLADLDHEALIARFEAVRAETVDIVRGMQESDLDRRGRHPVHGVDTLERFVRWAYEHTAIHEQDLRRALGS